MFDNYCGVFELNSKYKFVYETSISKIQPFQDLKTLKWTETEICIYTDLSFNIT